MEAAQVGITGQNQSFSQGGGAHLILALERLRQDDCCEFEAGLSYIATFLKKVTKEY